MKLKPGDICVANWRNMLLPQACSVVFLIEYDTEMEWWNARHFYSPGEGLGCWFEEELTVLNPIQKVI